MLRTLRENGPVVLVPLAWTFAAAAHVGLVGPGLLLRALVVMTVIHALFAALSWRDMRTGVLLAWKAVIVVGIPVTLLGVAALVAPVPDTVLAGASVAGWMLAPAAALVYTGRAVSEAPWVYHLGAALSVLGAFVYFGGPLVVDTAPTTAHVAGLALVGVGQTAGIVNAVVQY